MISGRKGDHATLALFRRELQQAVGRAAQLEGPAGLQALALEPHTSAPNFAFDQRGPLDESADPGSGFDDVVERDFRRFR
jgi:hypothetical protein